MGGVYEPGRPGAENEVRVVEEKTPPKIDKTALDVGGKVTSSAQMSPLRFDCVAGFAPVGEPAEHVHPEDETPATLRLVTKPFRRRDAHHSPLSRP